MENLGLGAYQSETQYLEENFREGFERQQGGNKLPVCCRFFRSGREKRQQSGNMLPLRKALSSMLQSACPKIGCNEREATRLRSGLARRHEFCERPDEWWQIILDSIPDDGRTKVPVGVDGEVPEIDHLPPGDFRMMVLD